MRERRVWVPAALSSEENRLKQDLAHAIVAPEAADELRAYLEDCFRRLLTTLDLVPRREGRVLELGANPYFFTMLLKKLRRYNLDLANFFGGHGQNVQRVHNERTGETSEFTYREFNIEEDEFPYEDGQFDGVVYAEILEHLIRDPIAVFAEIHRILKRDGWLIVTTPNVARRHNLMRLKRGLNIYDPYSGYGPYGRHNREYTAAELRELLTNTGFTVERFLTRDLHPCSARSKALALVLGPQSGYNLYAIARRRPEFHWYYPAWLFRSGLPQRRVRQPFVRMGINDAVQLGCGWWSLEHWPDGPMRWSYPRAEAFVLARGGEQTLRVLACGGPANRGADPHLTVQVDAAGLTSKPSVSAVIPRARWTWVEFRLPEPLPPGEVKFTLESPAFVPASLMKNGDGDRRQLGVGLREVEMIR
jgi:SAM-dependent methyltransferase